MFNFSRYRKDTFYIPFHLSHGNGFYLFPLWSFHEHYFFPIGLLFFSPLISIVEICGMITNVFPQLFCLSYELADDIIFQADYYSLWSHFPVLFYGLWILGWNSKALLTLRLQNSFLLFLSILVALLLFGIFLGVECDIWL